MCAHPAIDRAHASSPKLLGSLNEIFIDFCPAPASRCPPYNRCVTAVQPLCKRCATTVQPLCNHCVTASRCARGARRPPNACQTISWGGWRRSVAPPPPYVTFITVTRSDLLAQGGGYATPGPAAAPTIIIHECLTLGWWQAGAHDVTARLYYRYMAVT